MANPVPRRCGVVLFVAVLVSGCASHAPKVSYQSPQSRIDTGRVPDECSRAIRSCGFEGQYDRGERAYAESEAKLLNQAELARLRAIRL